MNKKLAFLICFEAILLITWIYRHDDTEAKTEEPQKHTDIRHQIKFEEKNYEHVEQLWNKNMFNGIYYSQYAKSKGKFVWKIIVLSGIEMWSDEGKAPFIRFEYQNYENDEWLEYSYCKGYYLKMRDKGINDHDTDSYLTPDRNNIESEYKSILQFMKSEFPHINWERLTSELDLVE